MVDLNPLIKLNSVSPASIGFMLLTDPRLKNMTCSPKTICHSPKTDFTKIATPTKQMVRIPITKETL